jgi:hypothetical protein
MKRCWKNASHFQIIKQMNLKAEKLQLTDDLGNDLLADVSISNLMQEVTTKLINNIEKQRMQIITDRLKEIVGIDLNIEEEAKRRFKRLSIDYKGNEETIYFNDGSEYGIRIVTFVRKDEPISFEPQKASMQVDYSYY